MWYWYHSLRFYTNMSDSLYKQLWYPLYTVNIFTIIFFKGAESHCNEFERNPHYSNNCEATLFNLFTCLCK